MKKNTASIELLRAAKMRATPGRIRLLSALSKLASPASVPHLKKHLGADAPDDVTLYRALDAFAAAGMITRSDLQHGHAHYELAAGRPHHHHAVCKNCGAIEDIEVTHAADPVAEALRRAKRFASIHSYAFEFFGLCVRCS